MSSIYRIFRPPAACRGYSSFFSKPGNGRYFNGAKPAKTVVANHSNGGSAIGTNGKAQTASADDPTASSSSEATVAAETEQKQQKQQSAAPKSDEPPSQRSFLLDKSLNTPHHPVLTPKEFKLHQFFSLHRPLLLINDAPAILKSAPDTGIAFSPPQVPSQASMQSALHDMDHNIDVDAETARQLSRALTMSQAGSTVDWENTLRRLGLNVDTEQHRQDSKAEMEKEWKQVLMDSVKRKRRKKMKKHKLKKRRRLTRMSRMKER